MKRAMTLVWIGWAAGLAQADDWPQWRGTHRDGVWRETGIVEKLPKELKFLWRTPVGLGYAGPAVAGQRVYVTDRQLGAGQRNPANPFAKTPVGGTERVLCLDMDSGKSIWTHEYPCRYTISYPAGPRATPTVHAGKVYSVGAMGDMVCLDADHGKVLWSKNFVKDFGAAVNTWGFSSAPLIDGEKVILLVAGADKSGVVALHKDTGAEIWRALEFGDPGYCPPMIFEAGGTRQLIIWSPIALHSLDPQTGKVNWQQPFKVRVGMSISTPVIDKDLLFVTAFYNGPLMMKLAADKPAASLLWKGKSDSEIQTDGLHSVMCTPVLKNGYIYGVCSYGQLRCLEAETGKRVWETFAATGKDRWWNAFIIEHQDRYFIHNEQGDLITARLSPKGYEETSRAFLIKPTNKANRRNVVWSHPAFAHKRVVARNDEEIVCVDLSAP